MKNLVNLLMFNNNFVSTSIKSCKFHNVDYDAEVHKLPSGKLYEKPCPKCEQINQNYERWVAVKEFLEEQTLSNGCKHIYNNLTKEWSFEKKGDMQDGYSQTKIHSIKKTAFKGS